MIWLSIAGIVASVLLVIYSGRRQEWNAFFGWLTSFMFSAIDLAKLISTGGA